MCGMYGLVGTSPDKNTLRRMGKTLRQRGPDDQGEYIQDQAGLGATRLSIIDLPHGNQPLFNEDKSIWAIQNGELYNYRELRGELENSGHTFRTDSDTEVYAHLYEEEGLEFVKKLRGMFALGLWDAKRKRLILARDRLGIKPLYYTTFQGKFLFASELKALLAAGVKRELNQQAFHDYLELNYVPGDQSIFVGIQKLPPAHYLFWEKGKVTVQRYWHIATSIQNSEREFSEENLKEQLLTLLKEAVKYHLVSDVPVGAFLSGGIDSSLVVALASKLYAKKLRTFSVGFEHKSYNELPFAEKIAKQLGTAHTSISLQINPQELVEKIGGYFDEPFADSSAVGVYAISQEVRKHNMKVVLTGDGGDEIFGGYVTYQADQLLKSYKLLPRVLREKVIPPLVKLLPASHGKMSLELKAKRFVKRADNDPLVAHFLWKAIFSQQRLRELLVHSNNFKPAVRFWQEAYRGIETTDTLNKLLLTDTQTSLPDDMLTKVDRMSMAHGLEVRVPLLDHKLVEFAAALPSRYKVRRFTLKYLLKQTLADLLPSSILHRPKAGFHVPVAYWLKHEFKDLLNDYLSPTRLKRQGYFNPTFVATLIEDHNLKRADYSRELWGLLMFSIWEEKYLKTSSRNA